MSSTTKVVAIETFERPGVLILEGLPYEFATDVAEELIAADWVKLLEEPAVVEPKVEEPKVEEPKVEPEPLAKPARRKRKGN